MMLPWITDDRGSSLGLSQPDGLLILIGGTGAMALAWRRVPFGWIVSGFLAVVLVRDVVTLLRTPAGSPGAGLWLGAIVFTMAAIIQLVGLIRSRRTTADPI